MPANAGVPDSTSHSGSHTPRAACLQLAPQPALSWGDGNQEKYKVAEVLVRERLTSATVVYTDSIVTSALFGRGPTTSRRKKYTMQVLAVDHMNQLDMNTHNEMSRLYQFFKDRFELGGAAWYMSVTGNAAKKMWDRFEPLRQGGTMEALTWVLRAYSLLIMKSSDVALKVMKLGDGKGFGAKATRDFGVGEYIYELIGLIATDSKAKHTNLSAIVPHDDQGEVLESRVLFGPIRWINHHCTSANVEFVAIRGCCGYTVEVTRPIKAGEELLTNYGDQWFKEGECVCTACKGRC